MRSFKALLNAAMCVAEAKLISAYRGKVSMKVTKDEYRHVMLLTRQQHPDVRLCDIPLRVMNG